MLYYADDYNKTRHSKITEPINTFFNKFWTARFEQYNKFAQILTQ